MFYLACFLHRPDTTTIERIGSRTDFNAVLRFEPKTTVGSLPFQANHINVGQRLIVAIREGHVIAEPRKRITDRFQQRSLTAAIHSHDNVKAWFEIDLQASVAPVIGQMNRIDSYNCKSPLASHAAFFSVNVR